MVSPTPLPPLARDLDLSVRKKRLKIKGNGSGEMPIPVSVMEIRISGFTLVAVMTTLPPVGVYCNALPIRSLQ